MRNLRVFPYKQSNGWLALIKHDKITLFSRVCHHLEVTFFRPPTSFYKARWLIPYRPRFLLAVNFYDYVNDFLEQQQFFAAQWWLFLNQSLPEPMEVDEPRSSFCGGTRRRRWLLPASTFLGSTAISSMPTDSTPQQEKVMKSFINKSFYTNSAAIYSHDMSAQKIILILAANVKNCNGMWDATMGGISDQKSDHPTLVWPTQISLSSLNIVRETKTKQNNKCSHTQLTEQPASPSIHPANHQQTTYQ